jgi:uncharacterized protein DUF4242
MKKIAKHMNLLIMGILFTGLACMAQSTATTTDAANKKSTDMKTYVIERNIPGAGMFTPEKLKDISKTSCTVLKEMGPGIQWIQSYVTGDKIFCVYKAENMDLIKEHAKRGGFPVNAIYEVSSVISPATATN